MNTDSFVTQNLRLERRDQRRHALDRRFDLVAHAAVADAVEQVGLPRAVERREGAVERDLDGHEPRGRVGRQRGRQLVGLGHVRLARLEDDGRRRELGPELVDERRVEGVPGRDGERRRGQLVVLCFREAEAERPEDALVGAS